MKVFSLFYLNMCYKSDKKDVMHFRKTDNIFSENSYFVAVMTFISE